MKKMPLIGMKIKELRLDKNLSSKEFCQKTSLDLSNFYRIENSASVPQFKSIEKICRGLGISVENFLNQLEKSIKILPKKARKDYEEKINEYRDNIIVFKNNDENKLKKIEEITPSTILEEKMKNIEQKLNKIETYVLKQETELLSKRNNLFLNLNKLFNEDKNKYLIYSYLIFNATGIENFEDYTRIITRFCLQDLIRKLGINKELVLAGIRGLDNESYISWTKKNETRLEENVVLIYFEHEINSNLEIQLSILKERE